MPLSPSHPIPCSLAEEEICPFLLWKSAAVIKPFSLFYSYSEIPWDEPLSPLHWDFPALGSAFKMLISPYPLLKITQDIDHGILPIAQTRKAWPTAAVAGTREAFVGRGGRSGAAFCLQAFESSWNRHSHLLSVTCMEKASRDGEQRYLWNSVQFFMHRVAVLFLQRLYSQNVWWMGEAGTQSIFNACDSCVLITSITVNGTLGVCIINDGWYFVSS